MKKCGMLFAVLLMLAATGIPVTAQNLDYKPRILLVTAHPDDDALYAATVFKTTHLLDGVVDLAVMTNGEGGYKYSTLGNYIYGLELDKEEVGRAYLPGIRKREVMAGGEIVGIRNYYFLDQVDNEFSYDITNPLRKWDTGWVTERLAEIMTREKYDFVFTMMPSDSTHAHHKASAILTLRALRSMDAETRPLALATTFRIEKSRESSFEELKGYPLSKVDRGVGPFVFDRTQTFGRDNRLNYNIIVNWVIAEHKSQGTMQLVMNASEAEEYWYYELNRDDGVSKVRQFFKAVIDAPIYFPDSTPYTGR